MMYCELMTEAIPGEQHYDAAGTTPGGRGRGSGDTLDNALAMTAPLVARFWNSENNSRECVSHALATSLSQRNVNECIAFIS